MKEKLKKKLQSKLIKPLGKRNSKQTRISDPFKNRLKDML